MNHRIELNWIVSCVGIRIGYVNKLKKAMSSCRKSYVEAKSESKPIVKVKVKVIQKQSKFLENKKIQK